MKNIIRKLSSRKFQTLIIGWTITGGAAAAGEVGGETFIAAVAVQGVAYILGEATVDAMGKIAGALHRLAGAVHEAVREYKGGAGG